MFVEYETDNYIYISHDSLLFCVNRKDLYEAIIHKSKEPIGHYWYTSNEGRECTENIFLNSLYGDEIVQAILFRYCRETI